MRRAFWSTTARMGYLAAIGAAVALAGLAPPVSRAAQKAAAGGKGGGVLDREDRILQTRDGGNLHISYYKSPGDKESPVVVLLHMKDGSRFVWQGDKGFARRLQEQGFAVVTVDLRYHGESKVGGAVGAGNVNQGGGKKKDKKQAGLDLRPIDFEAMAEFDMQAVKGFIKDEHQAENLNMNKMGIVGPEMGASIAVAYAAIDWDMAPYDDGPVGAQTPRGQDVRALVLISPREKYHGMAMAKVITQLKDPALDIAFLICCGGEAQDKKESEKVFKMAATPAINESRMFFKSYDKARLTGTDLLDKGLDLEDRMLAFFDKHLKKLDAPWRNRESRRKKLDKKKT
ncbi:MAG: alpha/beta hydrolase [Deltaproteobacteria bacterium]